MTTISILCEDRQHAAFITRFLDKRGRRYSRPDVSTKGRGAGEQFVRNRYPDLLDAVRRRNGLLLVMTDADTGTVEDRLQQLNKECERKGIDPTKPGDPVAVFVPRRTIETWFAWLDGGKFNEQDHHDKLPRERECRRHVIKLHRMCNQAKDMPTDAPPSLKAACEEWRRFSDR